jgi:hypothetical protein
VIGEASVLRLDQSGALPHLICRLVNSGPGAALNVTAQLVSPQGGQPSDRSIGTIATSNAASASFSAVPVTRKGVSINIAVRYNDLSGQPFESLIEYGDIDEHPSQTNLGEVESTIMVVSTTARALRR